MRDAGYLYCPSCQYAHNKQRCPLCNSSRTGWPPYNQYERVEVPTTSSSGPAGFKEALNHGLEWAKKEVNMKNDMALLRLTGDADIDDMLRKCIKTLETKGNDYTQGAGDADRLKNFVDGGEQFDLPPEKVLGVYLWKHLCAVMRYIKEGQVESEPIESRIMDVINYMLLLHKMVKEKEKRK